MLNQKIVMHDKMIESWLGHVLLTTTSTYCEKRGVDFAKTFLGAQPPQGTPSVDIKEWIDSLERHVEEESLKKAAELVEQTMADISYDLKSKFDEVIESRLDKAKEGIK